MSFAGDVKGDGAPSNFRERRMQRIRIGFGCAVFLVLAAVVTMYIVLGILYESAIHPITILSTLPSATVGALLALCLTGRPLDMIAIIGIVLLIGLVKKNGIMMVDFALTAEREQGMKPQEAIYRACLLRFRPIMMTTMCALVGTLPIALGWGAGAESRHEAGSKRGDGVATGCRGRPPRWWQPGCHGRSRS